MSSYSGRHAELYDTFYAHKPYAAEAGFIDRCLKQFSQQPCKRLLELACGTGEHALALERLGYQVVATDNSEDMLLQGRQKAERMGSHVEFLNADMRDLTGVRGAFDGAVCLFDSLGYLVTNEAINQSLKAVADRLRPGGVFIFEFWHAPAMLRSYEAVRVRRYTTDDGLILRVSETQLQPREQVARVLYSVYELGKNGRYVGFDEVQDNRYFQVPEMAHFLSSAGLNALHFFAGFSQDRKIDEETWHVVCVSQR